MQLLGNSDIRLTYFSKIAFLGKKQTEAEALFLRHKLKVLLLLVQIGNCSSSNRAVPASGSLSDIVLYKIH